MTLAILLELRSLLQLVPVRQRSHTQCKKLPATYQVSLSDTASFASTSNEWCY